MLDDLPLPRHQLQALGHVLAKLVQRAAAARAGRWYRIDDTLARQVIGQRPAGRLATGKGLTGHARRSGDLQPRLRLGLIFLKLEQLQLELLQQRTALRRLPEPFMLQLGYPLLELLDAQGLLAQLGAISLALGQQHRLQRFDVVRKRGIDAHTAISAAAVCSRNDDAASESPCRTIQPCAAAMYAAAAASPAFQQVAQLRRRDGHRLAL